MHSTTLTRKNQITIPEEIRKFLGIKPGQKIELVIDGDKVFLRAQESEPPPVVGPLPETTLKDVRKMRSEAETEMGSLFLVRML